MPKTYCDSNGIIWKEAGMVRPLPFLPPIMSYAAMPDDDEDPDIDFDLSDPESTPIVIDLPPE